MRYGARRRRGRVRGGTADDNGYCERDDNANDAKMQYDAMYLKGRPLMRNRLNPVGKLALLNTDKIIMKYLPASASMQRSSVAAPE